ncbi:uncharacterized protein EV420DRAFT_1707811 [Desarmillaria tabescens]|uniref:Uncharacterized protein n=1 Tax=Armillaria tabescens TaxID=1929756 RepID=A0AA39MXA4_ARMTA|nr:uncharacterized protein EV420DRAFT_1707811 [Desarmillaria tabescens]KAK0449643.1 hypothetical protein EV420DRAFT_1707811 [Desarmillaria tabescens]
MARSSNLDTWIQIAKVAAAVGDMAPFPYIKGIGGCAVLILEAIQGLQKAGKNDEDLLDLAEAIGETIELIQDAVEEHDKKFEKYLTYLHDEVNSTRLESRGRFKRFKRFLKRNEVCDAVNGYQERVHMIKEKFMACLEILTDIKHELRTGTEALTSAIEMSQRHTMANIDKHADSICEEIHTLGVLQSKKADELSADVRTLEEQSSYKGYVQHVLLGDIHLRDCLDHPNNFTMFTHYNADIGNTSKIQFHIDADKLIKLKHQNIAQVFGVCRSPEFPAIILHGTTQHLVKDYRASLTATQLLHFHFQLHWSIHAYANN